MDCNREADIKILSEMPKEKIIELFFAHNRSLWAVDGLYFLGIEKRSGTQMATEIDAEVWAAMARIEAKKLKSLFDIKDGSLESMMKCLRHSVWSFDLEEKQIEFDEKTKIAVFRNTNCRTQNTRIRKGLSEFPCKPVRFGYLKAFAAEFNPHIEVTCKKCPPDAHPQNLWCEWEFREK